MAVKRIYSYQTTDEKLHATAAEAHTHQLAIDVRGLMQSNTLGRLQTITATDVAQFIAAHATELSELLRKYREKMRHAK